MPSADLAREVEALGFGALWVGGSPSGDLAVVEDLLAATDRLAVATGIVNMWTAPADVVGASYIRIDSQYPGRFLLGLGIGHPEAVTDYRSPLDTITAYLDELDAAGVPAAGRVLAALGPKVLSIAARRTAGAHPYLTTPAHTREAREILGPGPLLAPEQMVVVSTEAEHARAVGRARVREPYLRLANYRRNLTRLGYGEEELDAAGDRVVDDLVIHGDAMTVAAGLARHLSAGADHVCAQVLTASGQDDDEYRHALRELANALTQG
jgi:probable F420-dependent oxidoreductase